MLRHRSRHCAARTCMLLGGFCACGCSVSTPGPCEESAGRACAAPRADALWYHAPNICEHVQLDRASPGQMLVVASMEPAAYYPCLDNPAFMGLFDLEMSYRMQVRRALPNAARIMHMPRLTTCKLLRACACGIRAHHDATVLLPRASSVHLGMQADARPSALPVLVFPIIFSCSQALFGCHGLPDTSRCASIVHA